MHYQWILDVLNDLRTFAKANGLQALAEQLDDTTLIAAADIAQATRLLAGMGEPDARQTGAVHRQRAANDNA